MYATRSTSVFSDSTPLELRLNSELSPEECAREKRLVNDRLVRTRELIEDSHSNADAWLELAESFFSSAVTLVETFDLATDDEKQQILLEIDSSWRTTTLAI